MRMTAIASPLDSDTPPDSYVSSPNLRTKDLGSGPNSGASASHPDNMIDVLQRSSGAGDK